MSNIGLIVFFTAGVFLVFVVHELGHLLTARYFGVRVLNISVGLGPEIVGLPLRSSPYNVGNMSHDFRVLL